MQELCALCLINKDLKDSHLIPANFYKVCRAPNHKNPHPFLITNRVLQTSQQIKQHLLCNNCEQLFHKEGEDHVSRFCLKHNGKFRLNETLRLTTPISRGNNNTSHFESIKIRGFDYKQFSYFAISLVWRSCIKDWNGYKKINIDNMYIEELRKYLLKQSEFPKNTYIQLVVSKRKWPSVMIQFPYIVNENNNYTIRFIIPGMEFWIHIGESISEYSKGTCLFNSLEHPVFFSDNVNFFSKDNLINYIKSDQQLYNDFCDIRIPDSFKK